MASQWITVAPGIRCREHPYRKHGVKPDRYFTIRFYIDGTRIEEGLGWTSEGWTLARVKAELVKLKEAKRTGQGETTLSEKRAVATAKRKAEARQAEDEARRNVTLATYWTETYEPWGLATKPKAMRQERSQWRTWIKPTLGDILISEIGMDQWDHLIRTLSGAGLSERSREYISGTLRRILKHARERRVIAEAPPTGRMVGATAPKSNRRQRVLSDEDLHRFLAALRDRDINSWRLTLFAAGTGCRASEAFGLCWGNLDLTAGTAIFPRTKNGRSRTVPLGEEVLRMLAEITQGKPTERVFLNGRGNPYRMTPSPFRDLADELGLNEGREPNDRFCFHSLRHMAATRLARVLPLRGLMDVMGWEVAAMALRYSHTAQTDMQVAAQTLDAALRPSTEKKVVPLRRKRGGS